MKTFAAALAITAIAGCGDSGTSRTSATRTIAIRDFKYAPAALTVAAGTRVTWRNEDAAPHTATLPGGFDTGSLQHSGAKTLVMSKPGTYTYVCEFHPFMKGTITVQ